MISGVFWVSTAMIVYAYAGYPLLLGAAAAVGRKRAPARASFAREVLSSDEMISCVVPALDEGATIAAKLQNLIQDLGDHRFEIIVVDDGSADDTAERASAVGHPSIRVISHDHRRGKPSALNTGVAGASGSILVLSDADVFLQPGSIGRMLDRLAEPNVGIVGAGRVLSGADDGLAAAEGLYWRYEQFIQACESDLGACVAMSGAVLVLRRDSYRTLPADLINDDFYLAMQVLQRGERAIHEPTATAVVGIAEDASAERRRRQRIVAGRWQAIVHGKSFLPWRRALPMWEVSSHKLLRPMVPFIFMAALVAAALAAFRPRRQGRLVDLRGPFRAAPLLAQLLFLAVAALGTRLEGRGRVGRVAYLATYLVSSNGAAVSGLVGYVRGTQSARWQRAMSPHQGTADV